MLRRYCVLHSFIVWSNGGVCPYVVASSISSVSLSRYWGLLHLSWHYKNIISAVFACFNKRSDLFQFAAAESYNQFNFLAMRSHEPTQGSQLWCLSNQPVGWCIVSVSRCFLTHPDCSEVVFSSHKSWHEWRRWVCTAGDYCEHHYHEQK